MIKLYLISFIFILFCISSSKASVGDETVFFQNCYTNCRKINCTLDGRKFRVQKNDYNILLNKLVFWQCSDDCQYDCMWRTVRAFHERKWKTPQFFGKWPFKRIWGMQEVGSVIGSALNLVSHIVNFIFLLNHVSKRHPFLWLWKTFSIVCINGWIWSTIFHTRDTSFTEFMDYASAFSMTMIVLYCFGIRVLFEKSRLWRVILTCLCIAYYLNHAAYLYTGDIDYSYNMIANITAGTLGGLGWTIWSFVQLYKGRRYVWRCLLFILLTAATLYFEINDFPPQYHFWDAHAVWHLSTSPLSFLFYRFIIDDCKYLKGYLEKKQHFY